MHKIPSADAAGGNGAPITHLSGASPTRLFEDFNAAHGNGVAFGAIVRISGGFDARTDRLVVGGVLPEGLIASYDRSAGRLSIEGAAPIATYTELIRAISYSDNSASPGARRIDVSLGGATELNATGHYYRFVPQRNISWTEAKAAAGALVYFGRRGHLATVATRAENELLDGLRGSMAAWLGATDEAKEGDWRWVSGPEAGRPFWNGDRNGGPVGGSFAAWSIANPAGQNEDYLAMRAGQAQWRDLANQDPVGGYLVEFEGGSGDPAIDSAAVVSLRIEGAAPAVSAAVQAAKNSALTLELLQAAIGSQGVAGSVGAYQRSIVRAVPAPMSAGELTKLVVAVDTAVRSLGEGKVSFRSILAVPGVSGVNQENLVGYRAALLGVGDARAVQRALETVNSAVAALGRDARAGQLQLSSLTALPGLTGVLPDNVAAYSEEIARLGTSAGQRSVQSAIDSVNIAAGASLSIVTSEARNGTLDAGDLAVVPGLARVDPNRLTAYQLAIVQSPPSSIPALQKIIDTANASQGTAR